MARLKRALCSPAWISFVWFGVVAGVSLLATPARFAAETATRSIALDVSRSVFNAVNKAELIGLVILLIVVRLSGQARQYWAVCGALVLILIAQSAWLLPALSARTDMIIAGTEPPASFLHGAYSMLELSKLLLLAFIGFHALSKLAHRPVH